jgi:hypothetical protein
MRAVRLKAFNKGEHYFTVDVWFLGKKALRFNVHKSIVRQQVRSVEKGRLLSLLIAWGQVGF